MKKAKVLFFSADPLSPPHGKNPPLRLAEEMRQIRQAIDAGTHRVDIDLDYRPAARPDDLLQALIRTRPQVVHFSGHGEERGLVLVDPRGRNPHCVDGEALKQLFKTFKRRSIRVVVLNACYSLPHAQATTETVECAIGYPEEISDSAAIAFGAAFYRGLACGCSVKVAFDHGRTALAAGYPEQRPPELVSRPGVKPERVFVGTMPWGWLAGVGSAVTLPIAAVVLTQIGGDLPPGCGWDWGPPQIVAEGSPVPLLARPTGDGPQADLTEGKILAAAGNHAEAFIRFKRAAEAGLPEAMGYLGTAYMHGLGTARQERVGFEWVHRAALKRDPRSMNELGVAYQNGQGTTASRRWARHWYRAAADEKDWPDAMRNLGRLFRDERDYNSALDWYRTAVRAGSLDAAVEAGEMYQQGEGGTRDLDKARCLYGAAAVEGSPVGMFAIGRVYQFGVGVSQDYDQAMGWYRKAAAGGSVDAMYSLGLMYQNGWGVRADRTEAIRWYIKARDAGSLLAPGNLRLLGVT